MSTNPQQPSVDIRAMFDGIENAKGRMSSNYIRPGRYWANIKACKASANRKGEQFVAVEMQVIKVIDDDNGNGHRVLEDVTHMLMAKHDSFMGNIKKMISDILDVPQEEITSDEAMQIVSPEQPLANTVVEFNAFNTKTQKGNDFTVVDYSREIPINETAKHVDVETLQIAFPGGILETLMQAEEDGSDS